MTGVSTYLKVFRDIFQKQFLIFLPNIDLYPDWARYNINILPSIASINLSVSNELYALVAILTMVIVGMFGYWKKYYDPKVSKTGLEGDNWSKKSKNYKFMVYALLFFTMTAFQGLNLFIYISFAELSTETIYIILAVIQIGILDLYFPYYLYTVIIRDKPTFLGFSQSGDRSEFTREQYTHELHLVRSPYKFLFRDFTYQFAFFELITMTIKALLQYASLICTALDIFYVIEVILLVYFLLEGLFIARAMPYSMRIHNKLVIASSIQNFLMTLVNLFFFMDEDTVSIIQVILFWTGILTYAIMVSMNSNAGRTAPWIRNLMRRLDFTTVTYKGIEFSHKSKFDNYVVFNMDHLDLKDSEHEVMLWQRSWEHLFEVRADFKNPNPKEELEYNYIKDCPPWLDTTTNSVQERFLENRRILEKIGFHNYEDGLMWVSDQHQNNLRSIIHQFVGLDAYYPDPNAGTSFGKLFVVPFPFTAVLVYDDNYETVIFNSPMKIQQFINANNHPETNVKRMVRYQLRCLHNCMVNFQYTETKSVSKTRTRGGKSESYSVSCTFTYKRGLFSVGRNDKTMKNLANGTQYATGSGFKLSISYSDGTGIDAEGDRQTSSTVIGPGQMGLDTSFKMTPNLSRLMQGNVSFIVQNMPKLKELDSQYRKEIANDFIYHKMNKLSYAFTLLVSREDYMNRDDLNQLLTKETNPKVQSLTRDPYVDLMFEMRKFYEQSDQHAYWWLFFSDIWHCNSELKAFQGNFRKMSPFEMTSICYNYMGDDRHATEKWLEEAGLRTTVGRGFMSKQLLDRFFYNLERVTVKANQDTSLPMVGAA